MKWPASRGGRHGSPGPIPIGPWPLALSPWPCPIPFQPRSILLSYYLIGLEPVLPSFTVPFGSYYVLLGFTTFYYILLHFTTSYWVLLGFTGFYWVLLVFTGFKYVKLGFTGFLR